MDFEQQLESLSLSYFEEDEHPRNHGKFVSKNGGGNEESDYGYDREAIRAKIRAEDSSKKLGKFLSAFKLAAYAGGTYALVKSGHPILAAALAGGAAATTYRRAIFYEAPRISIKYGLKTAGLAAKVATAPVWIPLKVANAGARGIARGVKEGIGLEQKIFEISLEFSTKPELLLAKYDPNLHPKDKLGRWAPKGSGAGTIHGNQIRPGRVKKSKQRFEIEPGETEGQGYKKALLEKKLQRKSAQQERHARKFAAKRGDANTGYKDWAEQERIQKNIDTVHQAREGSRTGAVVKDIAVAEGTSFFGRKIFKGVQSALAKFGLKKSTASAATAAPNLVQATLKNSPWPAGMHAKQHIAGATTHVLGANGAVKTAEDAAKVGTKLVGASRWGKIFGTVGKTVATVGGAVLAPEIAIPLAIAGAVAYHVHRKNQTAQREREIMDHERKLMQEEQNQDREFNKQIREKTAREVAKQASIYAAKQYAKEAVKHQQQAIDENISSKHFQRKMKRSARITAYAAAKEYSKKERGQAYQTRESDSLLYI